MIHLARATQYIKDKNLKLLFIGDGPERAAIAETLERHFAGRFTMLGAMQHHEIVPYYSAADLSIPPSLMEATSISCLEAMAAGLPIYAVRLWPAFFGAGWGEWIFIATGSPEALRHALTGCYRPI